MDLIVTSPRMSRVRTYLMSSQLIDTINRHLHASQWPSDITTSPATKEQYENILVSALIIKGANLKKQNKVESYFY